MLPGKNGVIAPEQDLEDRPQRVELAAQRGDVRLSRSRLRTLSSSDRVSTANSVSSISSSMPLMNGAKESMMASSTA